MYIYIYIQYTGFLYRCTDLYIRCTDVCNGIPMSYIMCRYKNLVYVVCYGQVVLNGVPVSTGKAEEKKVTCDSIVCGRYTQGDDDNDHEVFGIGRVRHIALYVGHILLCVEWFEVGDLDDDQRVGLTVIPVKIKRSQDEMWIDASSIIIQKNVVIRPSVGTRSFHVAIKP